MDVWAAGPCLKHLAVLINQVMIKFALLANPVGVVSEDQKSELLGSFPSNHDHHQALASTNIPLGALGLRLTSANDEEAHIHDSL